MARIPRIFAALVLGLALGAAVSAPVCDGAETGHGAGGVCHHPASVATDPQAIPQGGGSTALPPPAVPARVAGAPCVHGQGAARTGHPARHLRLSRLRC